MNRQDIIDKMTLSEKEVFEKYKDTYPFPIHKFFEEIGIKVVEKNNQKFPFTIGENDAGYYVTICKGNFPIIAILALGLVYFLFGRDKEWGDHETNETNLYGSDYLLTLSYELITPKDILFKKLEQLGSTQKISNYFGVPTVMIENYIEILNSISANSSIYH